MDTNIYLEHVYIMISKSVLLSLLFISILSYALPADQETKTFPRSDCIVEVTMNSSSLSRNEWYSLTLNIGRFSRSKEFLHIFPTIADISATFKETQNTQSIYIQYVSRCTERIETTRNLMKYFKKNIPSLPSYIILKHKILPGPKTIDVCGRYWSDCHN